MATNDKNYFDPKVLAGISNLALRARWVVEGLMSGVHRSRAKGFSVEFEEHREYSPGDEIRRIDWKALGKFDRYYIKEYEDETNLRAHLVLDASASMNYASDGISKFDYGCTLTASLAYLILKQQDSAGLVTFSDRIEALRHFRFKGNDVIVFHVLDQAELDLPFEGNILFEDLEAANLQVIADPRAIRSTYQQVVQEFIGNVRKQCHDSAIDYQIISTATPLDRALASYLSWRG
jgi:hypothetical protein